MKHMNVLFIILVLLLGIVVYISLFQNKDGFQSKQTLNNEIEDDIIKLANDIQDETGNYDNYNHYNKTSIPTVYYGSNGSVAKLKTSNGIYTIIITDSSGNNTTYNVDATTQKMYYGPHGGSATVIKDTSGKHAIKVTDSNGTTTIYSSSNKPVLKSETKNMPNARTITFNIPSSYDGAYTTPSSSSTSPHPNPYASSLPKGIPKSMIRPGDEDLYILKSEVVPPVCPVCPPPIMTCPKNDASKCPPCPACARCPEPSFECKKVPNYSGTNQYLPQPVLNNFSTFGM